jgi:hypothetical protein
MTDHYFRFPDQATMLSALRPLGMTYMTEGDEPVEMVSQGGHQYALHEVGELPEATGYHLNVRVVDPEFDVSSLAEFEVIPTNPRCIWA